MDDARAEQVIEWTHHKETAVSPTDDGPSFCRWLLANVPQEVAASFTSIQLSAIESALKNRSRRRLPLNIRLSIPFFRGRLFLVFLGGSEKRSPERRSQDRKKHALWTFANAGVFAFIFLFLIPAFMGMGHILTLYLGHAPTSIFWALALLGLVGAIFGLILAHREDSSKS